MEVTDIKEETETLSADFSFSYEDQQSATEQHDNNQFYSSNENIFIEPDPSTIVKVEASLLQEIDEIKVENPCDEIDIEYHQIDLNNYSDVSVYESDGNLVEYSDVEAEEIVERKNVFQSSIGEDNYLCKTCGKNFKRKSVLKSHELLHVLDKESSESEYEEPEEEDYGISSDGDSVICKEYYNERRETKVQPKEKCVQRKTNKLSGKNMNVDCRSEKQAETRSKENFPEDVKCKSNSFTEEKIKDTTSESTTDLLNPIILDIKKIVNNKCYICGMKMTHKSNVIRHIQTVHLKVRRKRYYPNGIRKQYYPNGIRPPAKFCICHICGRQFRDATTLKYHLNSHTEEGGTCKCDICGKIFIYPYSLRNHLKVSHSKRSIVDRESRTCATCGRIFSTKRYLRYHTRVHTGDEALKCLKCGKQFVEPFKLRRHMKMKFPCNRRVTCAVCDEQFTNRSNLLEHLQIVHKTSFFKCSKCGKCLSSALNLKVHMNMKISCLERVKCATCDQWFASKASLEKHLPVHTSDRTLECTKCGKLFLERRKLMSHLKIKTSCTKKMKFKGN